jgi:hypothetical protein
MTTDNSESHKGWFYLRNDGAGLPACTGEVFSDRVDQLCDFTPIFLTLLLYSCFSQT